MAETRSDSDMFTNFWYYTTACFTDFVNGRSESFLDFLESFRLVWKLSWFSRMFPDSLEAFQFQKISKFSGFGNALVLAYNCWTGILIWNMKYAFFGNDHHLLLNWSVAVVVISICMFDWYYIYYTVSQWSWKYKLVQINFWCKVLEEVFFKTIAYIVKNVKWRRSQQKMDGQKWWKEKMSKSRSDSRDETNSSHQPCTCSCHTSSRE